MSAAGRIDVVYFDAASGHRSSARGLARALREETGLEARAVDLLDVTAGHPPFQRVLRAGIDYFNWWLRREAVWDLKGLINLSLLSHDLVGPRAVPAIARYWEDDPPLAVVSVTPMYNGVLAHGFAAARPDAPYIVLPVDFEEGKRRYWFEPRADLHYLLTTRRLEEQARELGIPTERVHRAGGMVIDPGYYAAPPADPATLLAELGLDAGRPTGLISFGGQGSVLVERCAAALERVERPLNVIALCGRDEGLRRRLEARPSRHLRLVYGFTPAPPVVYHQLADFLIGKPGSMTITEAVVTGTPVLPIRARGMWVVQRGNERWVEETEAGVVVPRPAALPAAVRRVLDDGGMGARLRALRHEGVYEAARIVAGLAGAAPLTRPVPAGTAGGGPSEG